MTRGRVREVSKGAYRTYLRKADDFASLSRIGLREGNANGAGLSAIHAVISACDALTSFHAGTRSTGQSHGDVADLLQQLRLEGAREKVDMVRAVLGLKNQVEYEDRAISLEEATRLVAQMERVLAWVGKNLPGN